MRTDNDLTPPGIYDRVTNEVGEDTVEVVQPPATDPNSDRVDQVSGGIRIEQQSRGDTVAVDDTGSKGQHDTDLPYGSCHTVQGTAPVYEQERGTCTNEGILRTNCAPPKDNTHRAQMSITDFRPEVSANNDLLNFPHVLNSSYPQLDVFGPPNQSPNHSQAFIPPKPNSLIPPKPNLHQPINPTPVQVENYTPPPHDPSLSEVGLPARGTPSCSHKPKWKKMACANNDHILLNPNQQFVGPSKRKAKNLTSTLPVVYTLIPKQRRLNGDEVPSPILPTKAAEQPRRSQ